MSRHAIPLAPIGRSIREWSLGPKPVTRAKFTADGSGLVYWQARSESSPGGWHSLWFIDFESGERRVLETRQGRSCTPSCLTVSPDGGLVLTAGYNEAAGWFNIGALTGSPRSAWMERIGYMWIHSGAFHPDGGYFFLGTDTGVELWSMDRSKIQEWPLFNPSWLDAPPGAGASWWERLSGKCSAMAVSSDGARIFWSYEASILDAPYVSDPAVRFNGNVILDLEPDPDLATPPRPLRCIPPANVARFLFDSTRLITGHRDGSVRMVDLDTFEEFDLLPAGSYVEAITLSCDECEFAVGCRCGTISLWVVGNGRPEWVAKGCYGKILDIAFDRSGGLLTATDDGAVVLWGM